MAAPTPRPRRVAVATDGASGDEVSRTTRSAQTAAVAVTAQLLLTVLSFATRSVFVAQLGAELLGVNALLTSVLAILMLADLGINGALMFSLYAPLSAGDTSKVASIVQFAKSLYKIVAVVVGAVGLLLMPFLDKLVTLDSDVEHLHVYYLILLVNAVVGYLMVHRTVLLNADQKMHLVMTYAFVFNVARSVCQIVILLVFQSFLGFLVVQVVCSVLNNGFVFWRAGRLYPFLRQAPTPLSREDRRTVTASVRATLVYRVGGVVLNNTDPILISLLVGTVSLGYYSNYMLIIGSIAMLAEIAFTSFGPSVGNLVASGDRERGRRVFEELNLLAVCVYGGISVGLLVTMNEFIELWIGDAFVLSQGVVVAAVVNFYIVGVMAPVWAFRGATGMFRETQYVFVVTALLNLVLSTILGTAFGIEGILVATVVARLTTSLWYEPWVLLSRHLSGGVGRTSFARPPRSCCGARATSS